jgi:hypothetical protein
MYTGSSSGEESECGLAMSVATRRFQLLAVQWSSVKVKAEPHSQQEVVAIWLALV